MKSGDLITIQSSSQANNIQTHLHEGRTLYEKLLKETSRMGVLFPLNMVKSTGGDQRPSSLEKEAAVLAPPLSAGYHHVKLRFPAIQG